MLRRARSWFEDEIPKFSYHYISTFLVIIGLYFISIQNDLVFHGIVEIFSISIAFGMLMIISNSRARADPDQLIQVLDNIVTNAVQSMPDGGMLTVRTSMTSVDIVSGTIADTGVGMPPENIERVFEPLFTTKARGIGLGLSISKTIIEAHGGMIDVASEVGRGSTFTINLPAGSD